MSVPVPMYGFGGGGGTSLNFDVKAYATEEALLADTPKENTIGIITTNKITGWMFAAADPAEPVEGMVYITTGTESDIAFNALKKNGIMVYPLSAKQYVNGAWVDVTAMSYQGGEWRTNSLYIYNNGSVTGYSFTCDDDLNSKEASITDKGTYLLLSAGANSYAIFISSSKIDVTKYKTLKMTITDASMKIDANRLWFGLSSDKNVDGSGMSAKTAYAAFSGNKELSVDISSVTGSMYVALHVGTPSSTGSFSARVTKIWFE